MSTLTARAFGPWRLTFVTNPDDCNLACEMCSCGSARARGGGHGPPRRMEPSLALGVLDERRRGELREVIPSTLGEPLLWAGIDALFERCAALGLRVNLTTNGTWPVRGALDWSRRLAPLASDVKVSLNGATPKTAAAIMGGVDFASVERGVRTFARVRDEVAREGGPRARLSFQVTLQRRNIEEAPAIVRLAAELGVDRVKFNHLQPRVPGYERVGAPLASTEEGVRLYQAAMILARGEAQAAERLGKKVLLENASDLDPARPVPLGVCRFLGKEAWIHHDGRFGPCPHPAAALGAESGGLGDFGSVGERTLGELWRSETFLAFVRHWPSHPVCMTCPLRSPGGAFSERAEPPR